jgi:hypothetical protein
MKNVLIKPEEKIPQLIKTPIVIIGILMILFSVMLTIAIVAGFYFMIKSPENYGLIQIVMESLKVDEKLIVGVISGIEIDITISKAVLNVFFVIVFVSFVRAATFVVDVFGKLGVSILKLGVEINNKDKGYGENEFH